VNPLVLLGSIPVFADIDPITNTMDPDLIESLITNKTKAVIPVHLYGHPAEMKKIMEIAEKHSLKVISDACQAHGAKVFGHNIGTIADIACFSFFPSKNMTVAGEGGMITTNDPELAQKMSRIRDHGRIDKHSSVMLGLNLRLSELHAAIGRVQLKHLPEWVEAKRERARMYSRLLEGMDDITIPEEKSWAKHAYYVYAIRTDRRDELAQHLKSRNIASGVHYRIPVHKQPYILNMFPQIRLEHTETWADQTLSIPLDPQITSDEMELVVSEIRNFLGEQ
jgi:dTDP-4-amino-4,6-dideoxygalactose transaminase